VLAGTTPVLVHNATPCRNQLDQAFSSANNKNKLHHIFGKEEHGFSGLVERSGGEEQALRRIVDSLADVDDLPIKGQFEVARKIYGQNVTIRGFVPPDGVPRIGTAFDPDAFPGH